MIGALYNSSLLIAKAISFINLLSRITAKVPATKQKEASTPESRDNLEHSDNDKKMS